MVLSEGKLIAKYTTLQRSKEVDPEMRSEARKAAVNEFDSD